MARKKSQTTDESQVSVVDVSKLNPEILHKIAERVFTSGFVPEALLYEEFGPEEVTKAIALLHRTYRLWVQVRRPWTDAKEVLGYVWSDKRFSKSEAKAVPEQLKFLMDMKKRERKYHTFERVQVQCRWTNMVQAGHPSKRATADDKETFLAFERDHLNRIVIPAYCLRAMSRDALSLIEKEQAIARNLGFKAIRLENIKVTEIIMPVIEFGTGRGLGTKIVETIPPGTEFLIEAIVPTSVLTVPEFLFMLKLAGEYVRLSPGGSRGYGDFELVDA